MRRFPSARHRRVALLIDLQTNPVKGLSLLLVLRSDYQTLLEDIGLPSLRQGENFYQIGRFTIAASSDFLARSGLELRPEAIERLLTSAAELDETPRLVRPITLNVIGYVLATGKTVAASLDAGQLVRGYIEQTVGRPLIRDFAQPVLEQLVTEQGTKRPRSEQELEAETHLRRAEIRAVMNDLDTAALARALDPPQGVWELSHDFIARAVVRYLGRRRRDLWRRSAVYAAPALLTAIVLVFAGVIGWNFWTLPYKIRTELGERGLSVAVEAGGLAVCASNCSELTQQKFSQVPPLLAQLTAVWSLKVQSFNLRGAKLSNIEPLEDMDLTALQSLDLGVVTGIEDLEPLKGLTALRRLDLSFTKVRDLEPLKGLTALQWLSLVGVTRVENIEPLKPLTELQLLHLGRTNVEDLEPLKGLSKLGWLDVSGTRVRNLEPLKGLTLLQHLDLGTTRVESLEPLRGLTVFQTLHVPKVQSLEPVEDLAALRELYPEGVREEELVDFKHHRQDKKLPPVTIH